MSDYYNYYRGERRVPGILALILVAIIFSVPLFFLRQPTKSTKSLGAASARPFEVVMLNVTATSADLFWKTNTPSSNILTVRDSNNKTLTVSDIRDTNSNKKSRKLHYFSLRNLQANSKYFVTITQDDTVLGDASTPYFTFTTLASSAITTSLPPVYGKITDELGKAMGNMLLVAKVGNAHVLGGFTKPDGSFLVSLCCLYDKGTGTPLNLARNEVISLHFENEAGKKAVVSAPITKTSPFQENIIVGREINLTNDSLVEKPVLGTMTQSGVAQISNTELKIYYPKDSAVIPGKRPLVKGTAIGGNVVKISFPVHKRTFETTTNAEGIFEFSTPFDLKSGTQTVVVQSKNASGKLISITQTFTIPKSGETVLGEATPSGSLITPTVTVTPTDTVTPEPTTVLIPTSASTPVPTLLPTGIDFSVFSMMSAVLILFGVGLLLIF